MVTKCLTILPCGESHLPHCRDLGLAGMPLVPSLQTTPPPRSELPVPAPALFLGHSGVPCTLLGRSGESPGTSSVSLQSVVQSHIVSMWLCYVLSLSVGRMHPVRGARLQHLHCSGHHIPQPREVITCRWLSCTSGTSCHHLPLPISRAV